MAVSHIHLKTSMRHEVEVSAVELFAALTEDAIDLNQILHCISHPHIGARVLFSGEIRSTSHGSAHDRISQAPKINEIDSFEREVVRLEYTAHKILAQKHMLQVLRDAAHAYPLMGAVCLHRLGMLQISESAVAVLTCGRHRRETYAANQYIIDRVKAETPIWKREFFADGTSLWGENCN